MNTSVCLWDQKKGGSCVSRKFCFSKLQPDVPNLGDRHSTLEHEIRISKVGGVKHGESQPEVLWNLRLKKPKSANNKTDVNEGSCTLVDLVQSHPTTSVHLRHSVNLVLSDNPSVFP